MSEILDNPVFGSEEDITAAILRGEVIGGVFVEPEKDNELGAIVPANLVWVDLSGSEAVNDYTLGEFQKPNGEATILISRIFPGRHTREWRLTDAAGRDGYEETEMQILGAGAIQHRAADGTVTPYSFDGSSAQHKVHVQAGESFMFAADPASAVGAVVLSVVTRAFQGDYETVVQPSSSES